MGCGWRGISCCYPHGKPQSIPSVRANPHGTRTRHPNFFLTLVISRTQNKKFNSSLIVAISRIWTTMNMETEFSKGNCCTCVLRWVRAQTAVSSLATLQENNDQGKDLNDYMPTWTDVKNFFYQIISLTSLKWNHEDSARTQKSKNNWTVTNCINFPGTLPKNIIYMLINKQVWKNGFENKF